jgi:carboxylesterase type B
MVWIQGGMFELSSTAAYDGAHFARDGVVCVVINWRPGAEGFLYLADGTANVGLL